MDALFHTGYPHPINVFATLVLTALPVLSPFTGREALEMRSMMNDGVAGLLALCYLIAWSRLRVIHTNRSPVFYWAYLLVQTALVSLIYFLDGGLTRFLFVVVAVQAVYLSRPRAWIPFLGSLGALWLTLYLVISPDPGASMVATIGMYFLYLIFAAMVTLTTVQQERQAVVAQELLAGVDRRHQTLRAFEQIVGHRTETQERERLAQTIAASLQDHLTALVEQMDRLLAASVELNRQTARAVRLQAKGALGAVRQAVQALRPGQEQELDAYHDLHEDDEVAPDPRDEPSFPWTDPLRVYHVWNVGVIVVTTGVVIASALVGDRSHWTLLLGAGLGLLVAYGGTATAKQPWSRTLCLVIQSWLIIEIVSLSGEPLMNHLFIIVAAQMVFLVPTDNRWLVAAVIFPTLLSAAALWLTNLFVGQESQIFTLTAAFTVTNFFGAVMAFMTRREVEARQRAVTYAEQLAEVNRLLEQRVQEIRQMAIARERVRMAREIHDGLGHHLTIVIVELQYAEELADEDRAAALQHISSARRVVQAAMAASWEMSDSLERFDQPLPVALLELVGAWQQGNGVLVTLRIDGEFAGLPAAARITLYRAVQESLTNIQKHARAHHVVITLVEEPQQVSLTVTNDTTGAAPLADSGQGGFGLVGLKERADSLHGEFRAEPQPDGGFRVHLVLPLGV